MHLELNEMPDWISECMADKIPFGTDSSERARRVLANKKPLS